jgi:glycerol dehydrogenase-like iron-containing ADH family enzyme
MAVAKDLPLILVPTIVSTGAIIHGHCPRYREHSLEGDPSTWVWADCEYVLIDYDLTLAAPIHLHTAGLGDVLCGYSGIAEWRRNRRNLPETVSEYAELAALERFLSSIVDNFPLTLNERGQLTPDSIRFIMHTIQQRDLQRVRVASAPAADHAFLFAMQEANNKEWIHGEAVALGALIISWNCNENVENFAGALDRCLVRRRPSQMGIERQELRQGLAYLPEYLAQRRSNPTYNSVMREEPIVGKRFDQLWEFLETT